MRCHACAVRPIAVFRYHTGLNYFHHENNYWTMKDTGDCNGVAMLDLWAADEDGAEGVLGLGLVCWFVGLLVCWFVTVVLRLFLCFTCPAITVVTVIEGS